MRAYLVVGAIAVAGGHLRLRPAVGGQHEGGALRDRDVHCLLHKLLATADSNNEILQTRAYYSNKQSAATVPWYSASVLCIQLCCL